MTRTTGSIAAAIAVLIASTQLAAADERRVAVVVASQTNASDTAANLIAGSLERVVADQPGAIVVPWSETSRMMEVAGANDRCLTMPTCIRDLASRVGADELLFLSLVQVGDRLQVDITWGSGDTGKTASRRRVSLRTTDDAEQAFREIDDELLPRVAPEPASVPAAPPQRRGRHLTTGVWVTGGIGAAGLIAAGTLGVIVRGQHGDCEDDQAAGRPCSRDRLDGIDTRALIADALLIGSVAALGTATVLYLLSDDDAPPPDQGPTVQLGATPGGAYIGLRSQF